MASTRLEKTFTASNRKTFTISTWIKRSALTVNNTIYGAGTQDATDRDYLVFLADSGEEDKLYFNAKVSSSTVAQFYTNRRFRDLSAWYHIVLAFDTTQATDTNRMKLYVNSELQSFQSVTYPSQNQDMNTNNTVHKIGSTVGNGQYFDGSMTHFNFIDGTAYDADDFGESDSVSGIWKPKTAPSVTYGTNGFFLKFENSGAMGTDSSGNSNTFTVSGNLTQNVDTPSNNFITINPLDNYYPACTFSNGNTTVATGNNYSYCQSTIYVNKGKWYWEVKAVSKASGADEFMIGIQGKSATGTNSPAQSNNGITYYKDGDTYGFGGGATSYGNSYTVGDIIGVALDCDNNKLYFSKNGTWQNSGDPTSGATGTGALAITDPNDVPQGGYSPVGGAYTSVSHTLSFNFGQGYFGTTAVASANADDGGLGAMEYDVPANYRILCTKNIKDYG